MKVPSVKVKAMDKYKEIVNKGTDSSTKSQQYLDGLLRIPLGILQRTNSSKLGELKTEYSHLISGKTMPIKLEDDLMKLPKKKTKRKLIKNKNRILL